MIGSGGATSIGRRRVLVKSDDELPVLARQVLDEKLTSRKLIKQCVKDWRPDFLRA